MKRTPASRVALAGLLLAMMLVLGYVESLMPLNIGVPGIKLGLSNGVLIFAVYCLNIPTAYVLMTLKVLLSGLMFGGVSAMLYAFSGGILSLTVMCLLSDIKGIRPELVGIAGGACHNIGQLLMAMLVMQTTSLAGYILILLPAGMICGVLTGICARAVMKRFTPAQPHSRNKKERLLSIVIAIVILALITGIVLIQQNKNTETQIVWDTENAQQYYVG